MPKSRKKKADRICKFFYVDVYNHPVCNAPDDFRVKCGKFSTEEGMVGFGLGEDDLEKFVLYRCDKLKNQCDKTGHLPSKIADKYRKQMDNKDIAAITFDFTQNITRVRTKIGRNEPCPCGSGKKYKKCCGR